MKVYCKDICIYQAVHKPTPKLLPLCTSIVIEFDTVICKVLANLKNAEAQELLYCLCFHNHPF